MTWHCALFQCYFVVQKVFCMNKRISGNIYSSIQGLQEYGEMLLRRIEIMCVHSINISRGYSYG